MGNYGRYMNHIDFYNNLSINDKVKYHLSENETINATVIEKNMLNVGSIMILGDNKKKYILFPRQSSKLENII
tara:strand:+ start:2735 stop:2953 length:219 start_codon:yes stop_codon:yes gene_type:complete